MELSRRSLIVGAALVAGAAMPVASATVRASVVVIGGGFAGATAARYVKRLLPSSDVTLIEPNETYTACPFSNLVIGGGRSLSEQQFRYAALEREGIKFIQAAASRVDAGAREVTLEDGVTVGFDRLIMAPGIDIRWGAVEGYDVAAEGLMPHAWKAGDQTTLLQRQLDAMPDGGLVVMSSPAAPYRCPPGPYERASLIAHYLKTRKPASKLIVLDSKDSFSKMPLFTAAWADMYPEVLEWRGAADDGRVTRVDTGRMRVETDFEGFEPDVANIIPPQRAGAIADIAGVADQTGWCPIDATSFESTLQSGIHVIGDAAIANPMPKSAFSANLQGKLCAIQVARILSDLDPEPTVLANTCYSYVSPDMAVSIAGVYSNADGRFSSVEGAGGLSPLEPEAGERAREAAQAAEWFRTITSEAFG